jgi:hypothetical protein
MKLAFLLLLLVNIALFAWHKGLLGLAPEQGREPQRLLRQIAPESVRVLTPQQVAALGGPAKATPSVAAAKPACFEFGDFDEATLARVQPRLAALTLGERLQARSVDLPAWFVVFLPPAASRVEAERRAQDLRGRGLRDVIVMGEATATPNAILLGSFRDPALAQKHQADLAQRGIKDTRLAERGAAAQATRFEIRDVEPALAQQLAEIQKEFPQSRLGACEK